MGILNFLSECMELIKTTSLQILKDLGAGADWPSKSSRRARHLATYYTWNIGSLRDIYDSLRKVLAECHRVHTFESQMFFRLTARFG